jgi:hypothetical protein
MSIHISTNKEWAELWEGRRTFVSAFGVWAERSGPVHRTEGEARKWAQEVVIPEENRSSQELSPDTEVKPTSTRKPRKAKATRSKEP